MHSLPSSPADLHQTVANCTTEEEVDSLFSDTPGLKMLFAKGAVVRTNVILADNEFEYYRLVGEAYNTHLLERATVPKQ